MGVYRVWPRTNYSATVLYVHTWKKRSSSETYLLDWMTDGSASFDEEEEDDDVADAEETEEFRDDGSSDAGPPPSSQFH